MLETRKLRSDIHRKRKCLDEECGKRFYSVERITRDRKFPQELIDVYQARFDKLNARKKE